MTPLLVATPQPVPCQPEQYPEKIEGKMPIYSRKNAENRSRGVDGVAQEFDSQWRLSCSISHVDISSVQGMIQAHYLHKRPGIVTCCLGMYHYIFIVGVIVFAMPPRELNKRYGGNTWELARLYICDDIPRNAETWFISKAVKHVQNNHPEVMYLVSYADPSAGHSGTIYKAANWQFDGMTDAGRKTPRCDYLDTESGKKYSRHSHIPEGSKVIRIPRVSKYRFKLRIRKYAQGMKP